MPDIASKHHAEFRFYEELNDFLPRSRRKVSFRVTFLGRPAVKDTIESLGVPHAEVDLILVNGESVGFDYHLRDGDGVAVYPVFESFDIAGVTHLRPVPLREPKFILDVHLGKLARLLRLLGFDTLYRNDYSDIDVARIAQNEHRIILTRDVGLLKIGIVTHGYWVRATRPLGQIEEVIARLDLLSRIHPFTRCIECNGEIMPAAKHRVRDRLPGKTACYYDEFYECANCHRVYWRGSHYARLQAFVGQFFRMRDEKEKPSNSRPGF